MLCLNQSPEGMEKLWEDLGWWKTFFGPAWSAYCRKDYKELDNIVSRYNEFITDPAKK